MNQIPGAPAPATEPAPPAPPGQEDLLERRSGAALIDVALLTGVFVIFILTVGEIAAAHAAGALVMLMQAGFCLLETGFARAKNGINVALRRLISLTGTQNVELRIEAFNLLNSFSWGTPINNLSSGQFGRITTQQGDPRIMQFGVKYDF